MKKLAGLLPFALIYQVIDIGNKITQRTSEGMTKRNTALHTSCGLLPELVGRDGQLELFKILYSLLNRPVLYVLTFIFQETFNFPHKTPLQLQA